MIEKYAKSCFDERKLTKDYMLHVEGLLRLKINLKRKLSVKLSVLSLKKNKSKKTSYQVFWLNESLLLAKVQSSHVLKQTTAFINH